MIRSLLTTSHIDTYADKRRGDIPRFMPLSLLIATLIGSLASLAACGSTAANTPTQTSAPSRPTATAVSAGTILFTSDWSKGLDGWQASDD